TDWSTNFNMVAEDGIVGSWRWEWNLSSGVGGRNIDNRILLLGNAQNSEQAVHFSSGVCWPDCNVVASGVRKVGSLQVDFHMQAVAFLCREKFLGRVDWCNIRIVGVEWETLCVALQVERVWFAEVDRVGFWGKIFAFL